VFSCGSRCLFALLGLDLPLVELELLALQDVAIAAPALARARCNARKQTPGAKLLLKGRLHLGSLLSHIVLLLRLLGALLVEPRLLLRGQLGALLPAERQRVVSLVPRAVRRAVDDHDAVLDERLGAHQLVVAGVVHHVDDTRLARDRLGAPGEVAALQSQRSVLLVPSARPDRVDSSHTQLGVGGGSTGFMFALLVDLAHAPSRLAPLVPFIS